MRPVIFGLALVFAVAGCTSGSTSDDSASTGSTPDSAAPTSTSAAGFPLVYSGPPVTVAFLREGTLHIDPESQCVTLSEAPDVVWVLVVPKGTYVDLSDEANPTLVMEGCRPLVDGDHVEFTGIGSEPGEEALREYSDPAYLDRCGATVDKPYLAGVCSGPSRR